MEKKSAVIKPGAQMGVQYCDSFLTPAVDVYETDDQIVMLMDLPGVEPSDVDIDLEDGTLTVLAKAKTSGEEGRFLLTEYNSGNYFRTFRVSDGIDGSKISASLSDGVLTIMFQKSPRQSGCTVPVTCE